MRLRTQLGCVTHVLALLFFLILTGCATPAPIKEATVALDDGYRANLKMMRQYDALVRQINERHELWWKFVYRRSLLKLAFEYATIDHRTGDEIVERVAADEAARQLGPDLTRMVNAVRLSGLQKRDGGDGMTVFNAGKDSNSVDDIILAIPRFVQTIELKVNADYQALVENDRAGIMAYKTNVAALRRINATIQRYLDIDVSMRSADVESVGSLLVSEDM